MISSFHIRNFKSYRDATLPLAPLTLLIGANASGKSNAIEAIRVLSKVGAGNRLDEIVSDIQSSDDFVRGNSRDIARDGDLPVTVGCELELEGWNRLEVSLSLSNDDARLGDEYITQADGAYLYRAHASPRTRGERFAQFPGSLPDGNTSLLVSDRVAVFPWVETLVLAGPARPQATLVQQVGSDFRMALDKVRFFDLQPRRMRGYTFRGEQVLKEDGANISAVLHDLCFSPDKEQVLLRFVAALPEQPFVEVGFITTSRGDVMFRLTESYGGREEARDAPVLSDGTLRVLGIAAALLSCEEGSTIVIEEIDNGVHPSRVETLLRNIEQIANERRLRVLLTTHNPALLDRLPTDAIPHVVCAYRDPEEGDSRLVRLEDLPNYPELVARGPLGQLMTRGVLDYFLKHQESDEERKEKGLRWIETLKAQVGDA